MVSILAVKMKDDAVVAYWLKRRIVRIFRIREQHSDGHCNVRITMVDKMRAVFWYYSYVTCVQVIILTPLGNAHSLKQTYASPHLSF